MDDISRHRRACFAILRELELESEDPEVSNDMFWDYIKYFYNINSRKELTEDQWLQLRQRLNIAANNKKVFKNLKNKVLLHAEPTF